MTVAFTRVSLPNGWLGNMSAHPVRHLGVVWRTAEALFQALRFDDPAIREELRSDSSPMGAKFAAKRHAARMTVEPTSPRDLANMELCLGLKLEQHPELKGLLLATGDEVIVEDVTSRRGKGGRHLFWGMAFRDGAWVGENRLGKLWMKLRDELRRGEPSG
jgi:predicted NAD-dependent protein-ADP-ribosyltransferase YbiA (DUF1768 family)